LHASDCDSEDEGPTDDDDDSVDEEDVVADGDPEQYSQATNTGNPTTNGIEKKITFVENAGVVYLEDCSESDGVAEEEEGSPSCGKTASRGEHGTFQLAAKRSTTLNASLLPPQASSNPLPTARSVRKEKRY
jgi:hypothetical protein